MLKDTTAFSSFSVRDIQDVKAFYSQTLGLEVSETMGMARASRVPTRPSVTLSLGRGLPRKLCRFTKGSP